MPFVYNTTGEYVMVRAAIRQDGLMKMVVNGDIIPPTITTKLDIGIIILGITLLRDGRICIHLFRELSAEIYGRSHN